MRDHQDYITCAVATANGFANAVPRETCVRRG
jgi:hypothetical protein